MKSKRSRKTLCLLRVEELETRRVLSGVQPTAAEQLLLEQLNDIRANPAAYGAAIGLDLSGVAPAQPLAIDPLLTQAALGHSQDMSNRAYFDHNTPDGVDPGQRLTAVGVNWASWGESIGAGTAYPNSASVLEARTAADFVVQQRILPVVRGRGEHFFARTTRLGQLLSDANLPRSASAVQEALRRSEQQFGELDFLGY